MKEVELIRKIRSEIMNHIHFEMNADNWKGSVYLVNVLEDIDNFISLRDREFEEEK